MKHLLNILSGLADAANPFGTVPHYHYPQPGERARDARMLRGDFGRIGRDLDSKAAQTLREHGGKVDNRSSKR